MKLDRRLRRAAASRKRRGQGATRSAWLAVFLLVAGAAFAAEPSPELEYKVKAGYLFNFARFVEWPPAAFVVADAPLVIAVLDRGEAATVIGSVLAGKNVAGRPVEVRAVPDGRIPADAHILLVTRGAGRSAEDIRRALGAAPTLLVGETEEFAERGGAIGFVVEDDSIRLTICLEHAAVNGLRVSARLASVARSVSSKRRQ